MDGGWVPPGGPAPEPAPVSAPGQPGAASPGEYVNWGLTAPPAPRYEPVVFVPRPPRPPGVHLALLLTYCGVALAGLLTILDVASVSDMPPNDTAPSLTEPARWVLTVFYVLAWLVPAAGTVVAAIFAGRGANAGRIVLASLMGLYALVELCQGLSGFGNFAGNPVDPDNPLGGLPAQQGGLVLITFAKTFVLAGLALAIGVLLLRPAANRYFSPGPGRRWAPIG